MRILDIQFQTSRNALSSGEGTEIFHNHALSSGVELCGRSSRQNSGSRQTRHLHQTSRRHRSRSSPSRFKTATMSVRRHLRSPSVSPTRAPVDPRGYYPAVFCGDAGTVAYYSRRPPVQPLYLVPLPTKPLPVAVPPTKPRTSCFLLHPDIAQAKKKEAQYVVRRLIRSFLHQIPMLAEEDTKVASCGDAKSASAEHRDIAVQARSAYSVSVADTVAQNETEPEWIGAEEKGNEAVCEWAGGVRALRDSHVRLLLRQLRQLRHIERLNRALKRAQPPRL